MNNWKVYCHTFPNGKKYVGITKRSPEERWHKDGSGYKGQVVYDAIIKYGWDNIKHEILKDNLTEQQAQHYEKEYIKALGSHITVRGYNCTWGGEGTSTFNDEAIYNCWLRHASLDYVANLFGCNKNTVRKILDRQGVSKVGRGSKVLMHKVNQYDLMGKYLATYESYKAAAKAVGGSDTNIRRCVRGEQKSANGYIWRDYEGNTNNLIIKQPIATNRGTPAKQVEQYDLNWNYIQTFNSVAEAARFLNKPSGKSVIIEACSRGSCYAYGYRWKILQ